MSLSKHIHFAYIDSTNSWAKREISQWADNGITLITAKEQSAGLGRQKRKWVSPPNVNLYASFCFWLPLDRKDLGHISQIMALSVISLLTETDVKAKIKWPNDIFVNKKKIGGILCETIEEKGKRGIICGIGLNINMDQKMLTDADLENATSLFIESNQKKNPLKILSKLEPIFTSNLERFISTGFSSFLDAFKKHSLLQIGEHVKFLTAQRQHEGIFQGFSHDGSLILLINNKSEPFHTGELII